MTQEEFERLFTEYYKRLVNWAKGKCPPDIDAQDLVNEAFASIKKSGTYRNHRAELGSALRWFQGAINNMVLRDVARRNKEAKRDSPVDYETDHVECPGCGQEVTKPDRKGKACPKCGLGLPKGTFQARASRFRRVRADRQLKQKLDPEPDHDGERGHASWVGMDRRIATSDPGSEVGTTTLTPVSMTPAATSTGGLSGSVPRPAENALLDEEARQERSKYVAQLLVEIRMKFWGDDWEALLDHLERDLTWAEIAARYPSRTARQWEWWYTRRAIPVFRSCVESRNAWVRLAAYENAREENRQINRTQ